MNEKLNIFSFNNRGWTFMPSPNVNNSHCLLYSYVTFQHFRQTGACASLQDCSVNPSESCTTVSNFDAIISTVWCTLACYSTPIHSPPCYCVVTSTHLPCDISYDPCGSSCAVLILSYMLTRQRILAISWCSCSKKFWRKGQINWRYDW